MSGVLGSPGGIAGAIGSSDVLSTIGSLLGVPVWKLVLQQASWRGIPFFVEEGTLPEIGRRIVVHEYPYRNAWSVEDIGQSVQRINLTCFLNSQYATAWNQRRQLLAANLSQTGPGELIHPSIGSVQAYLEKSDFSESKDYGGVVRFNMTFVVVPPVPQTSTDQTQAALSDGFFQGIGASLTSFVNTVGTGISSALSAIGISSIGSLFTTASTILGDAGIIYGAFQGIDAILGGSQTIGIYQNGTLSMPNPYFDSVDPTLSTAQQFQQAVQYAIGNTAVLRSNTITTFGSLMTIPLTQTDPTTIGRAIQAAIAALTSALISPADQTRLLATAYTALGSGTDAFTLLIRQTILANLLPAVQATTLASQQDAAVLQQALTPLFDAEISITADPLAFMAICAMKAALVEDLQTRGIQLPEIITVTRPTPLPSFTIAWQLYSDATRADEITIRNNPVHPAFIPSPISALSY